MIYVSYANESTAEALNVMKGEMWSFCDEHKTIINITSEEIDSKVLKKCAILILNLTVALKTKSENELCRIFHWAKSEKWLKTRGLIE